MFVIHYMLKIKKSNHNLFNILVRMFIKKNYFHSKAHILIKLLNNKNYLIPKCYFSLILVLFILIVTLKNLSSKESQSILVKCSNINLLKSYNRQFKY